MESNLSLDEVPEQDSVFHEDNEDDFTFEEIGGCLDDQQGEPIMMLEPKKGMMFNSEDDAVRFYKGYAKKKGFGVIRRTTRHDEDNKLNYFTLACSRQGKAQYTSKNSFKPNPSTRMQCPCKINFCRRGEQFCITSVMLDHNHPTSPSKSRFLRCHKKLDLDAKRRLELNDQAGIRMNKNFGSLVIQAGGYDKLEFGEKECRNYLQETRRLKLGAGDAHAVYQYFLRMQSKDPDFFHVMDVDEDGRLRNVFWADARSRATYESYSDVITFDTTYLLGRCITHYDFERQFQVAYTNAKFQEFQEQLRGKIYCYPAMLNKQGSIYTFRAREDRKIFFEGEDGQIKEKRFISEFTVLFNQGDCNVQCLCRLFEFRGILCTHILSVLALMEMTEVPSKYILQRWRKDFKRKHTFMKCSYDDMLNTPIVQRYDSLCKRSHQVAENGAESDVLYTLVMNGLNELQIKIDAYRANHEAQDQDTSSKHEDTMLNNEKLVLSPIRVRSVGRPPSKRKESKIDQVVRKLGAKKQQVPTSTKKVPSQKAGKKKGSKKSNIGQGSSQQTEANTYCEGHEAGSAGFFPNEFQELQTTKPATTIHMMSYVDILQGNKDVMDLLDASLNG